MVKHVMTHNQIDSRVLLSIIN